MSVRNSTHLCEIALKLGAIHKIKHHNFVHIRVIKEAHGPTIIERL